MNSFREIFIFTFFISFNHWVADSFHLSSSKSRSVMFSPLASSTMAELINGPMTWNTVVGEADRAFRRGIQLEKSGQPRAANGAFHEVSGCIAFLFRNLMNSVYTLTLFRLGGHPFPVLLGDG